ncbi:hypothetical protein AGMMS49531_06090 [Endomicrobiia bacterium]|nr:hypothetical protein AGMMS49531_06090 [Endomicrobiia bacterium]
MCVVFALFLSSISLIFSEVAVLLFTRKAFFLSQELKTKKPSKINEDEFNNFVFVIMFPLS